MLTPILMAAEEGDPAAQFILHKYYDMGFLVRKNRLEAMAWLTRSAKQGYAPAETEMALKVKAKRYEAFVDPELREVDWLGRAKRSGNAMAYLVTAEQALMVEAPSKENIDRAVSNARKAAELGSGTAYSMLARLLNDGYVSEEEVGASREILLRKAHERHYAPASHNLAKILLERGDEHSCKEALEMLFFAVEKRYPIAMRTLSEIYEKGLAGKQVDKQLAQFLRRESDRAFQEMAT